MGPASTSTNRATQYAVPAIPSAVLLRPRIVEELTRRIALHAVVEVVGAPGVGKTTAVAQAAAASDRSVAWLTLAEWHREPGRLLDELVDALAATAPGLRRFRRVAGGDREAILASSARLGASSAFGSPVLLVLDDCHHLVTAPEAAEVLGALVRNRHDNLSIAIVGRDLLPLPELREAGRNDAVVGPDVLDANLDEARAILQLLGSSADAEDALAATGGWLAALAFESWRRPDDRGAGITPLDTYFAAEIRPLLEETIYELLVDTAVFDTVDEDRATALGHAGAGGSLRRLRERGFPAIWWADGAEMRVHPRVRELLRAELERRPVAAVQRVITAAAAQYEREGKPERALDLLLQADMPADARRLVPSVIIEIIARGDLPLAERLLALTGSELGDDVEPTIVLARLMLASARQSGIADVLTKLDELPRGRLEQLIVREPILGAYMCMNWVGEGRLSDAVKILDVIPPGRAAAAARLLLSLERDDPEAVAPAFAGDVLDPVVARGMWGRGMLAELREGWYEGIAPAAGLPGFVDPHDARLERAGGTLGAVLTRFRLAVERRDLDEVNATLEAISVRPWIWLSRAEAAVRVARDPESARSAIEDLRASPDWGTCFSRELGQVWEGGALLLAGDDEAAARVLREAVAGMRRGDRTLELPTALVYLAEAEWRLGSEGDADAATHAAFRAAVAHGTLRGLTLALGDFPAVLSRAIDAEPADSEWHALGRLLAGAVLGAGSRTDGPAPLHLRELGDPSLVDRGVTTRPKLKKSLELLSYLLSRPRATASRADVLVALWNGRDDESTRAYLRQVLRNLRECVSDDVAISAVGDTLSVEGPVSSDTGELEALLAEARRQPDESRRELLLRVVDILESGEFFAGSTGVNWIDERRVELRGKLATAYLDLAEVELRAGGYLAALDLVAAALAIDPLLERGWRMRMGAFARLGDARAFASAYAACEDALSSVGLTPSRATTRLFRQLGKEPPPG